MKLTPGKQLTTRQIDEVKRAYVHRFTGQHRPQWANKPMPNGAPYQPTHATDAEWINDHAFYLTKSGQLAANRHHCEPAFLAE